MTLVCGSALMVEQVEFLMVSLPEPFEVDAGRRSKAGATQTGANQEHATGVRAQQDTAEAFTDSDAEYS